MAVTNTIMNLSETSCEFYHGATPGPYHTKTTDSPVQITRPRATSSEDHSTDQAARRQDYSLTLRIIWVVLRCMPHWTCPSKVQFSVPHVNTLDCISCPCVRDYAVQHSEMNHGELQ
ncbi:hypothetical protein NXS19_004293 [Fusarium pseudograminearum]|nr:hypothetical protein NXS19_004293 [Fusarium pseudograminearum]